MVFPLYKAVNPKNDFCVMSGQSRSSAESAADQAFICSEIGGEASRFFLCSSTEASLIPDVGK